MFDGLPFPLALLGLALFVTALLYVIVTAHEGSVAAIVFGITWLFFIAFFIGLLNSPTDVSLYATGTLISFAVSALLFIKSWHDAWRD